ncbi:MAG: O-antigen ligase family protein [Minisyncoccota bacterium]
MFDFFVLFFIVFLPFQFALSPAPGIDLAVIRLFSLSLFLWWMVRSLTHRNFILPPARILFLLTAFLFWSTGSFLWAENPLWAMRKALFLLTFAPLFLVFYATLQDKHLRQTFYTFWVYSATVSASIGLGIFVAQFLFGVEKVFFFLVHSILPFFLGMEFSGTVANYPSLLVNISGHTMLRTSVFFPDPHITAFFFGMTIPFALTLFFESTGKQRLLNIFCVVILLLADALTFSRGGYVGLLAGLSVFFLSSVPWRGFINKYFFRVSAFFVLSILICAFSPIGARFLTSFSLVEGSNAERLRLWQEAGQVLSTHPWIGIGLGNYPLVVKPSAFYREPIYAHNFFLDIAVETGVIGAILFLGFLLLGMCFAWSKWHVTHDRFALSAFASVALFLVHAFFETPLFSVHILPLLYILMALCLLPASSSVTTKKYV